MFRIEHGLIVLVDGANSADGGIVGYQELDPADVLPILSEQAHEREVLDAVLVAGAVVGRRVARPVDKLCFHDAVQAAEECYTTSHTNAQTGRQGKLASGNLESSAVEIKSSSSGCRESPACWTVDPCKRFDGVVEGSGELAK